jgi:hypothetical protein
MTVTNQCASPPRVRLVGQFDHPDFEDAARLLRAGAQIVTSPNDPPELIVVAQTRPGVISDRTIQALRRDAPLAGLVALLGTWCEGETRTGRPWPGVERLYWYEFPAWWRQQHALRAAGRCPDWAHWGDCGLRIADCGLTGSAIRNQTRGLIVLSATVGDTAAALADALTPAGYATLWQPPGRPAPVVRGAVAAIWDGGQLSEREEYGLATFCKESTRDAAPVIALLDFPRRDRCNRARELGAATILGKPWLNLDLLATIEELTTHRARNDTRNFTRAA